MNNLSRLIAALIAIESSGNDNAVNGPCAGCMQIEPCIVEDCNRIIGKRDYYTLQMRFSRWRSIQMFKIIMDHYCTAKRLGHEPTMEDCARVWNQGWKNRNNDKATAYWLKVKELL